MKLNDLTDPLLNVVARQCKSTIAVYSTGHTRLFHGAEFKNPLTQITPIKIRTDRIPRNSTMAFTNLFNLCIEKKFGVAKIRSNSKFITNNEMDAVEYGMVSIAFIPDKAQLLFNPDYSDSVAMEDEIISSNTLMHINDTMYELIKNDILVAEEILDMFDEIQTLDQIKRYPWYDSPLTESLFHKIIDYYIDSKFFENYQYAPANKQTIQKLVSSSKNIEIMVSAVPQFYLIADESPLLTELGIEK